MKLFHGLLACLLTLPLALALDDQSSALLSTLPQCAAKCLVTNVLQSTCNLDDVECTCTNTALQQQVEACVREACTVKEGLSTKNTTMTLCGVPVRSNKAFIRNNDIMGGITGVFFFLRFATKLALKMPLGMDDLFMFITMITAFPCIALNSHGLAKSGLGKDLWTLHPDEITSFGRWFLIMACLYFSVQACLKLTMIFFYLRIFPGKTVRRLLWASVVFTVGFWIAFIIVVIFQCQPISYFWTRWDHEHSGKCASVNGITWSHAAINIALDFWILAIPLSQLRKMKLDWRKKVGVGLMFCVGTFVTIVSILRLYACVEAGLSQNNNPSWEYLPMCKWSTIELNVGVWCTCMPTLRLLLVQLFPKWLGTSKRYLKYGNNSDSGRKSHSTNTNDTKGHERFGSRAEVGKASLHRARVEPVGIVCDRTYEVQYGEDDETYLVHMKPMHTKGADSWKRMLMKAINHKYDLFRECKSGEMPSLALESETTATTNLSILDEDHRQILDRAIRNILSTEVAELTYAQILDGLPTEDSLWDGFDFVEDHPVQTIEHDEICPGFLEKARELRGQFQFDRLHLEPKVIQTMKHFQSELVGSDGFHLRLIELVAIACHEIGAYAYDLDQGGVESRRFCEPPPTAFCHRAYRYLEQYPRGLANVAGYWAESKIFGGVVVFDRGETEDECKSMWIHGDLIRGPKTLYPPTPEQFKALIEFLTNPLESDSQCPLPIHGTRAN
ncbi:hypothetical protein FLONG3_2887 [Fusarium longipes]|uniref:CFEM domain-containing protein n=1 Tax=Fusarium longipes TaxID=694270 RepID=A0A395T2T6_9HYPO|nr:hypothetical protein FLONG3_2887 [Fusarium longipes]